ARSLGAIDERSRARLPLPHWGCRRGARALRRSRRPHLPADLPDGGGRGSGRGLHAGDVHSRVSAAGAVSRRLLIRNVAAFDRRVGDTQRDAQGATDTNSHDRAHGHAAAGDGDEGASARPENASLPGDRRLVGEAASRVPDARGRLHARRDRGVARYSDRHVQGSAVRRARQAASGARPVCRRSHRMTDENRNELDDLIDAAAREYNRAGATPRDVMWERIRARRDAARREADVTPIEKHRPRWPIILAVAAVLVFGVFLGRGYERLARDRAPSGEIAKAAPPDSSDTTRLADVTTNDSASRAPSSDLAVGATPGTSRSIGVPRPRPTAPLAPSDVPDGVTGRNNLAYRLAVVEHLSRTEAMLTSFRSEARHGSVDAELTKWARDLLTTTRLLEAIAGAQDLTMKRLLGDLELVLMQIAHYTNAGTRS